MVAPNRRRAAALGLVAIVALSGCGGGGTSPGGALPEPSGTIGIASGGSFGIMAGIVNAFSVQMDLGNAVPSGEYVAVASAIAPGSGAAPCNLVASSLLTFGPSSMLVASISDLVVTPSGSTPLCVTIVPGQYQAALTDTVTNQTASIYVRGAPSAVITPGFSTIVAGRPYRLDVHS